MKEQTRVKRSEFVRELRNILRDDYEVYFHTVGDVENVVTGFLETITKLLSEGKTIPFIGFGTFEVKHRDAREGHNPKTGQKIKIASYNLPTFKAGIHLKNAVNAPKKKTKKSK